MERIIDYLAEELKKQEATKTRKTGKHERVAKLMKSLAKFETPIPVTDFLGD